MNLTFAALAASSSFSESPIKTELPELILKYSKDLSIKPGLGFLQKQFSIS